MPTFNNVLDLSEVSVSIERLFIAAYPTVWTPTRINFPTALPTSFIDLGAVVEDSPSFKVGKTKYTIDAGIPRVRQFEAVLGLTGSFSIRLHAKSGIKFQYATDGITTITSVSTLDQHHVTAIGGRKNNYYSILGVADFIDGSQVIHEMQKVSPAGDMEEAFRPDADGTIMLNFSALGWQETINGCTELFIAKRHYFTSLGSCV